MRERIGISLRYLKFFFSAKTKYQIHSPFVYNFITQVIEDRRVYYAFSEIEYWRSQLLADPSQITVTDFGAGSHVHQGKQRRIKQIAKTALSPKRQCQRLFRMILLLKPKTMLELGTSLGITACYQSAAARNAKFITLEGCPAIAKVAQRLLQRMQLKNANLKVGKFTDTLAPALQELQRVDYIFIDGHHQKQPTLAYFEQCLPYLHEHSVVVFDDIHWSTEMEEAWEVVKQHTAVTLSIDLFFMGIVFFRKDQKEKEHFEVVTARSKPWNMGFFK